MISAADTTSTISDDMMQTDKAEIEDTKHQHIDLEDVTHIITMTMSFRDHKAVEARNAKVAAAAEANGKQSGTAPGASGGRGDLIAVVTVSLASCCHLASLIVYSFDILHSRCSHCGSRKHVTIENVKMNNSSLLILPRSSLE